MQKRETQQVQQSIMGKTGRQSQSKPTKLDSFYEDHFTVLRQIQVANTHVTQQRGTK